jgi:hypothetical protein
VGSDFVVEVTVGGGFVKQSPGSAEELTQRHGWRSR